MSIENLKKERAFAWAKYYTEKTDRLAADRANYLNYQNINKGGEELPPHFTSWVEGLMKDLKQKIECPICMDIIEEGQLKITNCGHNYCSQCFKEIDKCAICRKKIYKKK